MTDEQQEIVFAQDASQDVMVGWSCYNGTFGAIIQLQNPVLAMDMITMGQGRPEVQYRVDQEEPVGPAPWTAGDQSSAVITFGENALTFANDLKFGSTVAIRLWNAAGERVTTKQFPIDKLATALMRLSCFVQQG